MHMWGFSWFELDWLVNRDLAIYSLSIAQHFNLAYTQLKIVNTLEQYGINIQIKFHYPTQIWKHQASYNLHLMQNLPS